MGTLKRNAGYTLLELMMVVSIIGILAGIAYPSYTEYVMKGRRSDAKRGLLTLQLAQEKFRSNCTQYATAIGDARSCAPGNYTIDYRETGGKLPDGTYVSPDQHYVPSVVAADATTYSLQATRLATGKQNGDKCGDYQINQSGVKSIANNYSGYTVAKCW